MMMVGMVRFEKQNGKEHIQQDEPVNGVDPHERKNAMLRVVYLPLPFHATILASFCIIPPRSHEMVQHAQVLSALGLRHTMPDHIVSRHNILMPLGVHAIVLPNEGYDEAHFDAYIERWSALAQNLAQGLVVRLCLMEIWVQVFTNCSDRSLTTVYV
eukprot:1160099-Pelagomonas_calceolata.AAC.5